LMQQTLSRSRAQQRGVLINFVSFYNEKWDFVCTVGQSTIYWLLSRDYIISCDTR